MQDWLVCPHPRGGWRIVTPARTQAAIASTRQDAIEKAEDIIAGEGGGGLAVLDSDDTPPQRRRIASPLHAEDAVLAREISRQGVS